MRTVITGAPGALVRIDPAALPADKDLRYSFWRYVDASGLDLSAYRLDDMDVVDSDLRGVVMPARVHRLQSRRSDWTGAVLPENVTSGMYDLVPEAVRQISPEIGAIVAARASDYRASWSDTIPHVTQALGSAAWIAPFMAALRTRFPLLFRWMRFYIQAGRLGIDPPGVLPTFQRVPVGPRYFDLSRELAGARLSYDRWAAARMLELYFWRQYELRVYVSVRALWPFPVIVVRDAEFIRLGGRDLDEALDPEADL